MLANRSIGSITALSPYQRSQHAINHSFLLLFSGLNSLYSLHPSHTLVSLRSTGLEVIDQLEDLKKAMISFAGGTDVNEKTEKIWPGIVADGLDRFGKVMDMGRAISGMLASSLSKRVTEATDKVRRTNIVK
jgi:hypothetical protein